MKTPRGEISDSIIALASDEVLLRKMSECKSPEEVYALVKDRVGIPFEQFTAEMKIANAYLQEMEAGLLTEKDLDAVAGGKSKQESENIGASVGLASALVGTMGLAYATAAAI
ncbi:MAG: hypothetical protein ACOX36_06265 [Saccharofermentanales bacterium]|jgi:hypothetical protein